VREQVGLESVGIEEVLFLQVELEAAAPLSVDLDSSSGVLLRVGARR